MTFRNTRNDQEKTTTPREATMTLTATQMIAFGNFFTVCKTYMGVDGLFLTRQKWNYTEKSVSKGQV